MHLQEHFKSPHVCIIARKNLTSNTRVFRQAASLDSAGFRVSVFSIQPPAPELQCKTPNVVYHKLPFPRITSNKQKISKKLTPYFKEKIYNTLGVVLCPFVFIAQKIYSSGKVLLIFLHWVIKKTARIFGTLHFIVRGILRRILRPTWAVTPSFLKPIFRHVIKTAARNSRQTRDIIGRNIAILRNTLGSFKYKLKGIKIYVKVFASKLGYKARSQIFRGFSLAITLLQMLLKRTVYSLKVDSFLRSVRAPWQSRTNSVRLTELVRNIIGEDRVDFVQAHDAPALIPASRIATEHNAKLVYDAVEITEYHLGRVGIERRKGLSVPFETAYSNLVERIYRIEESRLIKRANHVLTIGDGLSNWYAKRHGIAPPTIVRNCRFYTPTPQDSRLRMDAGLSNNDKIVLWFGQIYPAQGIERIIEAARFLRDGSYFVLLAMTIPKWESYLKDMMEKIESEAAGKVIILPARGPDDLIPYASGADVGIIPRPNISPNLNYSLPNKFLEMISARLPIAISDLKDMRAIVEKYNIGRVFNEPDAKDVARVLNDMLEDDTLRQLKANSEFAAKSLCWENEEVEYVNVYRNLSKYPEIGSEKHPISARVESGYRLPEKELSVEHK